MKESYSPAFEEQEQDVEQDQAEFDRQMEEVRWLAYEAGRLNTEAVNLKNIGKEKEANELFQKAQEYDEQISQYPDEILNALDAERAADIERIQAENKRGKKLTEFREKRDKERSELEQQARDEQFEEYSKEAKRLQTFRPRDTKLEEQVSDLVDSAIEQDTEKEINAAYDEEMEKRAGQRKVEQTLGEIRQGKEYLRNRKAKLRAGENVIEDEETPEVQREEVAMPVYTPAPSAEVVEEAPQEASGEESAAPVAEEQIFNEASLPTAEGEPQEAVENTMYETGLSRADEVIPYLENVTDIKELKENQYTREVANKGLQELYQQALEDKDENLADEIVGAQLDNDKVIAFVEERIQQLTPKVKKGGFFSSIRGFFKRN